MNTTLFNQIIQSDNYTGDFVNPANILNYFTANLNNINVNFPNYQIMYYPNNTTIPMFDIFSINPSTNSNSGYITLPNGKETLTEESLAKNTTLDEFSKLDTETKKKYDICSICFDEFKEENIIRKIKCNHLFHKDCVDPWLLKESYKCPVCRESTLPKPDT